MQPASKRYAEAARLITLARGMLATDGHTQTITYLDLAAESLAADTSVPSQSDEPRTAPESGLG